MNVSYWLAGEGTTMSLTICHVLTRPGIQHTLLLRARYLKCVQRAPLAGKLVDERFCIDARLDSRDFIHHLGLCAVRQLLDVDWSLDCQPEHIEAREWLHREGCMVFERRGVCWKGQDKMAVFHTEVDCPELHNRVDLFRYSVMMMVITVEGI